MTMTVFDKSIVDNYCAMCMTDGVQLSTTNPYECRPHQGGQVVVSMHDRLKATSGTPESDGDHGHANQCPGPFSDEYWVHPEAHRLMSKVE